MTLYLSEAEVGEILTMDLALEAVDEVFEEAPVVFGTHLARPHHRGAVDFRAVVNPLLVHIVVRCVADDDQMLTATRFEFPREAWPLDEGMVFAAREAPIHHDEMFQEGRAE